MAGSQITVYANQIIAQRLGWMAISLTNFDNTSEPQIAAGSKVEVGGALYEFSAAESITGWSGISVSTDVYIKLTVSGASVTASFTTTAPTWDTAKQGWYSGSDRYIGGLYKDSSGNYAIKFLYFESDQNLYPRPLRKKIIEIGDWNMDTTASISLAHGLELKKIRAVNVMIFDDTSFYTLPLISASSGVDITPHDYVGTGGGYNIQAANIALYRTEQRVFNHATNMDHNGAFDNAGYNATSYNRGYITIEYQA